MHTVASWNLPATPKDRLSFPRRLQCLWSICEECWQVSDKRPKMSRICSILHANGTLKVCPHIHSFTRLYLNVSPIGKYKTMKPFLIKNNLFRQISVRYFDSRCSKDCKTEVVDGYRHILLELDVGGQASLLNFTDGRSEYTLDSTFTSVQLLNLSFNGQLMYIIAMPLQIFGGP